MREIYLKGFEVAVKEGGTRGIMSSFNRLGTVCAAENCALLTGILRDEWGFHGTVITDCIMQTSYVNIDRAVRAGNDLILSLMGIQSPTDQTTGTTTGRQALRTASHNILYASANSVGQEISSIPVAYQVYIPAGIAVVGLLAVCVWYFIRRHQNMKAWKAANP